MALSTEQVLLLNNLMYMEPDENSPLRRPDDFAGKSVGEWLNRIDLSQIDDTREYGSFMSGKDWRNIIEAARQDDTLMGMHIAETHVDSAGGGGRSAIFTSSATGDAVVVFKGTESAAEWSDNFAGGNVTDTPHQGNALEWYQNAYRQNGLDQYEVTLSGHSKGGNKAKYITLLDDTVDRCVSFDGQGFSDEFMDKYAQQIAGRQSVIENHNVDYDYVNLLLNDVGKTTYYKGCDYGSGGFLENHCPNTFMEFDKNGGFTIHVNPDGQAPEMKALDEFLNNLIRSMPEGQQTETLSCINEIVNRAFSLGDWSPEENLNFFVDLLSDSKYSDELAYILAYTIEYEQAHPEFAKQINSVLDNFGMGDFTRYVDMVDGILNFDADIFIIGRVDFDRLYRWVTGVAGILPDGVLQWILDWVEDKYGVRLTVQQLKNLLGFAGMVYRDMQNITIRDRGDDITVAPVSTEFTPNSGVRTHGRTYAEPHKMRTAAEGLQHISRLLDQSGADVEDIANNLAFAQRTAATAELRDKLKQDNRKISLLADRVRQLDGALTEISKKYEGTENLIVGFL